MGVDVEGSTLPSGMENHKLKKEECIWMHRPFLTSVLSSVLFHARRKGP